MPLDEGILRALAGKKPRGPGDSSARDPGAFIPVIGPYVTCRTFAVYPGSHQATQRACCSSHLLSLASAADTAADNRLGDYIRGLIREDLGENPVATGYSVPQTLRPFALTVAELARSLTWTLADSLTCAPLPLERTPGATATTSPNAPGITELLTRALLDAAAVEKKYESEPRITIRPVRARLMRLAAIWLGVDAPQPECEDLRQVLCGEDHQQLVQEYRHLTGFESTFPWAVRLPRADRGGLTWRHVAWLNQLIRHLALSQTTAHRAQSEMAFVLSLYDTTGAGNVYFDVISPSLEPTLFYEAGSFWAASGRNPTSLEGILLGAEDNSDRPGGHPFHEGLARLLVLQAEHSRLTAETKPIVTLVTGFDREVERAVARELRQRAGGDTTPESFLLLLPMKPVDQLAERSDWRCLECSPCEESPGYTLVREVPRDEAEEYSGKVVVVRMAGSPLDRDRAQVLLPGYCQHVVMDEYDLVTHYMGRGLSLPQVLHDRIDNGWLYFLGMERGTLTDRVHIYAVGSGVSFPKRRRLASPDCDLDRLSLEHRAGVRTQIGVDSFVTMIAEHASEVEVDKLRRWYDGTEGEEL